MTVLEFIILLLIAGLVGAMGKALVGYARGGFLTSIALGFIGALLGTWIARAMGLPELFAFSIGGTQMPIIWSIVGSALFVGILALLTPRRVV
ncbi:MAG: GlsB/YeaQ/YmgE family stress response membrane protein [Xanthomonadales bacterium]|nr:GlsB/YeaQ/YmgE family stress response membrane protein [Xanthomonadales bacterium]